MWTCTLAHASELHPRASLEGRLDGPDLGRVSGETISVARRTIILFQPHRYVPEQPKVFGASVETNALSNVQ
jgi:hypothetical protein